ncbi:MAG TPA: DNA/RNA non-specific endonuclease [Blastocatellia bacterium]|nr:DNA/RNA non-specific endonuclease [Blastocatellia bacterium]
MSSYQFQGVESDPILFQEIVQKMGAARLPGTTVEGPATRTLSTAGGAAPARLESFDEVLNRVGTARNFEAIVERYGRPSLLVRNGTFEVPEADTWKARLYPTKERLDRAIRSVGRLELRHHPMQWAGTAWIIAENIAVTNRHVALLFAQKENGGFVFRRNPADIPYGARMDFREEHLQLESYEVGVEEVLFITDDDYRLPDLAFLRLQADGALLPPPIPLFDGDPSNRQTVAVIGYPAYDDRNDAGDMARIFGGVYGVKRFAPGEVRDVFEGKSFTHDCTTLGGNSGSVVIDIETGAALGLHFAGEYLRANYAVSARALREHLERYVPDARTGTGHARAIVVSPHPPAAPVEEPQPSAEELADREGYDSGFLGDTQDLAVLLPALAPELEERAARLLDAPDDYVLRYTHFSIVMNAERRLAFYTATNVDGAQWKSVKRKRDVWSFDPRIERAAQVGNELYRGNDLDRGHLTRRLDPSWGADFKVGERDTFFYTNCTPQHRHFNTRLWLELEDYLLENADTRDFRACIFTGPVFSDADRPFSFRLDNGETDTVALPRQYWKVAAMVRADRIELSATAYILSQADLISNLEFVFGQLKTYQMPIRKIEQLTRLDFGDLRNFDPLEGIESVEGRHVMGGIELTSPEQIRLIR